MCLSGAIPNAHAARLQPPADKLFGSAGLPRKPIENQGCVLISDVGFFELLSVLWGFKFETLSYEVS